MCYIRSITALLFIAMSIFSVSYYYCLQQQYAQEIIRFHVIAHSDSIADQRLKLAVRDVIVQEMKARFAAAETKEQAVAITKAGLKDIQSIAQREINRQGYHYPVTVAYGDYPFPQKSYQDLTLPAGNYQAVRVTIGDGRGENWWCVLFPPLCFLDGVKNYPKGEQPKGVKVFERDGIEYRLRVLELFR